MKTRVLPIILLLLFAFVISACSDGPENTGDAAAAVVQPEATGDAMPAEATGNGADAQATDTMSEEKDGEMKDGQSGMDESMDGEMKDDKSGMDESMDGEMKDDKSGMDESMDGEMKDDKMDAMAAEATAFLVHIENVSADSVLPSPLAPGLWATHSGAGALFVANAPDRGEGLEALAEDGNPALLAQALAARAEIGASGIFDIPVGKTSPAPIFPGEAYEFIVETTPAYPTLSLATMFVQSNDLFLAPADSGIALFDAQGAPISADVTAQFQLWDAGTELNETLGEGPNQAPRQPGPNSGPQDDNNLVRVFADEMAPPVTSILRVTITPLP